MDGPKRMWMQVKGDDGGELDRYERTHSENNINESDIEYIRADIHEAAIAKRDERIAVLTRALELAIEIDDPCGICCHCDSNPPVDTDACAEIVKDMFITMAMEEPKDKAEGELEVKDE